MKDFNYAPTFLGDVNGEVEYRYNEFKHKKEIYCAYVEDLREMRGMGEPKKVKVWEVKSRGDVEELEHPEFKAGMYAEIAKYIKEHESDAWRYAYMEEEVVEHEDPYDGYPSGYTTEFILYARVSNIDEILASDQYKQLEEQTEIALRELLYAKEQFIKAVKGM